MYMGHAINFLPLRKQAYSNILKILPLKNEIFQIKKSDIFTFLLKNIDCGCPHQLFLSVIKWMSRKICIYQGEPSINCPFTSKFVIPCICIASAADIFIILVVLYYSLIYCYIIVKDRHSVFLFSSNLNLS